jgi:pimeloyl-ACP methyl ester carboxylesterase
MGRTSPHAEDVALVESSDGWSIALKRVAPASPHPGRRVPRPVILVPGYGMNSFIFGFHPRGPSLEASLAARGIEVWSVDLRGQGRSSRRATSGRAAPDFGIGELAVDDLGAAIRHVLRATRTGRTEVDLIGCSLGASLVFTHLACVPGAPVHSVVSMGGLVTFVRAHPLVRAAFASPRLAGSVRLSGTRALAGVALPLLARVAPWAMSFYIHPASTDLTHHATMVRTVEDPVPTINREIAEWIRRRDLLVRGVNVSRALARMTHPFLCVVARHDGVVLPETSRAQFHEIGSTDKELLEVGHEGWRIAHADLFVSTGAQERIFAPVAEFLTKRA